MKKRFRKMCILLLCLFTVFMSVTHVRAEEESETEIIHSRFNALTIHEEVTLEVPFSADWFKADATVYSHDLAKLSMGLATAAFRPYATDDEEADRRADDNLRSFLDEAHFTDLRSDDYEKDPAMYTISTAMGHQRVGEGKDSFELIAVGVCGQGYLDEWESNFSIGDGTIHAGFDQSSRLVYDRIFGYIAENRLEGPYKLWISGFSRAAAVSNLTAARLVESDYFDLNDVFAYTFATPRTVIDEDYGGYENIFNIVGKADPVPCTPFADWGYERYGRTLYLPALETDSDFEAKREKANVIYKDLLGIDYWYNKATDDLFRDILAYFLEICPEPSVYVNGLQDKLIELWEDKTPINVTAKILEIANDPLLINENNMAEANMLLNYLLRFSLDFLSSGQVSRFWSKDASLGANVLQAHTPELYVSWLYSVNDGEELYNHSTGYSSFTFENCGEVSLYRNGQKIESLPGAYDDAGDGETELLGFDERTALDSGMYVNYVDLDIAVTVPRDEEYEIRVTCPGTRTIQWVEADYTAGRVGAEKTAVSSCTLDEGDTLTISLHPGFSVEEASEKGLNSTYSHSEFFMVTSYTYLLSRAEAAKISWRSAAIAVIAVIITVISLILFQLVYLIGKVRHLYRIRKGWIPKGTRYRALPLLCMFAVFLLYAIMQFDLQLFPDEPGYAVGIKREIALLCLLMALYSFLKRRTPMGVYMTIGVGLLGCADILISRSLFYGGIMHIIANIALCAAYCREERPGRRQIVAWGICLAIAMFFLFLPRQSYGVYRALAALYLAVSLAMVISSLNMPRRVFHGSLLLFLAGILLLYNQVHGETFISHGISLGVYYAAMAVLASAGMAVVIPRLVPEEDGRMKENITA